MGPRTRVPEVVQPILEAYTGLIESTLPGFMSALYIHGSIALGAFNARSSDIDFITVLHRCATAQDLHCLRTLHQQIAQKYRAYALEGSYLQWDALGCFERETEPHPYYHDGVLQTSGYFELNAVTWWVLKHHGIAVVGPEPRDLTFTVDWDVLRTRMLQNLNTYWLSWTRQPARLARLLTDDGIQWVVLGILRQYYTLREQDITSKTGAGVYALEHIPRRWHRIIRQAISIREATGEILYSSRSIRAVEAVGCLKYVIGCCNKKDGSHKH